MYFLTRFKTYFNPRATDLIKARPKMQGFNHNTARDVSRYPNFTCMLIFCQIGAWMESKMSDWPFGPFRGQTSRLAAMNKIDTASKSYRVSQRANRPAQPSLRS